MAHPDVLITFVLTQQTLHVGFISIRYVLKQTDQTGTIRLKASEGSLTLAQKEKGEIQRFAIISRQWQHQGKNCNAEGSFCGKGQAKST